MKNPGKNKIIIIVQKHTTSANDNFHDLPYYVARIQRRKRYVKIRWLDWHFPDHEVFVEIGSSNIIDAFNRFEEEGHAKRKYSHFRLIDLRREELYDMGYLLFVMMIKRNKFFYDFLMRSWRNLYLLYWWIFNSF